MIQILRSDRILRSIKVAAFAAAILAFPLSCGSAHTELPAERLPPAALQIGDLTPFYRGMQLQGHILGQGLQTIPSYLLADDIDLTYKRNPKLSEEIPFVDSFTITRFLGGYRRDWLKRYGNWNEDLRNQSLDYVVKGKDGTLSFRSEIIERRLKPYLDAGYKFSDMTLAMENTPWAIARNNGEEGTYGQTEPPADWALWVSTLEHFAGDLERLVGSLLPPDFKMGNEYDTRKSFDGGEDDYFNYYSIGYEVLHKAFPESDIVPGEFSGLGSCTNPLVCVYDTKDFLERAKASQVYPTYVPRSLNSFQGKRSATAPATVDRAVASYRRLGGLPAEVHQFGLLGQPFGEFSKYGSDQGPRAAAWEFIVLMGLQERLHPRRVFHWKTLDTFGGSDLVLLNGTGFLRLVLDRYLGAEMTRLPIFSSNAEDVDAAAVAFRSTERKALIVATSDLDINHSHVRLQIDLTGSQFPSTPGPLRVIRYGEDRNVFMQIRSDLAADNNLRPEFEQCAHCTAEPGSMATAARRLRKMLQDNSVEYEVLIKQSLRFADAATDPGIRMSQDGMSLELDMQGNEVLVLEADK